MKYSIFFAILFLMGFNNLQAQDIFSADITNTNLRPNHFSENLAYELAYGFALPLTPNKNIELGDYNSFLNFLIGANYKFNDLYGVRLTYSYDDFSNKNDSKFGVVYHKIMFEGILSVMNAVNPFRNYRRDEFFDLVAHAGVGITLASSKTSNSIDKMLNIQFGAKPTFRINNQTILFADFSGITNFSQDSGYDGLKIGKFNTKSTGFYCVFMVGVQMNFLRY